MRIPISPPFVRVFVFEIKEVNKNHLYSSSATCGGGVPPEPTMALFFFLLKGIILLLCQCVSSSEARLRSVINSMKSYRRNPAGQLTAQMSGVVAGLSIKEPVASFDLI